MPDNNDYDFDSSPSATSSRPKINRAEITSPWGAPRPYGGHTGTDLGWQHGENIGVARPGRVRFAGRTKGYGNRVEVEHDDGAVTTYSHLSGIDVQKDDDLDEGSLLGRVGNTGNSHGDHLHFEVLKQGKKINPLTTDYAPLRGAKEVKRRAGRDYDFDVPAYDFDSPTPTPPPQTPASTAGAQRTTGIPNTTAGERATPLPQSPASIPQWDEAAEKAEQEQQGLPPEYRIEQAKTPQAARRRVVPQPLTPNPQPSTSVTSRVVEDEDQPVSAPDADPYRDDGLKPDSPVLRNTTPESFGTAFKGGNYRVRVKPTDTQKDVRRRVLESAASSAKLSDAEKREFVARWMTEFERAGMSNLMPHEEFSLAKFRGEIPVEFDESVSRSIVEDLRGYQARAEEDARKRLEDEARRDAETRYGLMEQSAAVPLEEGGREQFIAERAGQSVEEQIQREGSAHKEMERRARVAGMTYPEYAGRLVTEAGRGALGVVGSALKGVSALEEAGESNIEHARSPLLYLQNAAEYLYAKSTGKEYRPTARGAEADNRLAYMLGDGIEHALGEDRDLAPEFAAKVARGAGSSVPFFVLGALGEAAVGVGGALSQAGDTYSELTAKGVKGLARQAGAVAGLPIGASEVFGVGSQLQRLTGGTFLRTFAHWLKATGREATEEAVQEFFQTATGEAVVQLASDRDPTVRGRLRNLLENSGKILEHGAEAAGVASIIGGGMGAVTGGVEALANHAAQDEETEESQMVPEARAGEQYTVPSTQLPHNKTTDAVQTPQSPRTKATNAAQTLPNATMSDTVEADGEQLNVEPLPNDTSERRARTDAARRRPALPDSSDAGAAQVEQTSEEFSSPVETTPVIDAAPVGFTTEQGSTYTVDGKSTQRTKSKHKGHDPNDVGLKEPSTRSVYLDEDAAREVGMWNTLEADKKRVLVRGDEVLLTSINPKTGARGLDGRFKFTETPEVGKSPLELWKPVTVKGYEGYRGNHPGNKITEIQYRKEKSKREYVPPPDSERGDVAGLASQLRQRLEQAGGKVEARGSVGGGAVITTPEGETIHTRTSAETEEKLGEIAQSAGTVSTRTVSENNIQYSNTSASNTPEQKESAGASPEWQTFPEDSGSLNVPRASMPQIKSEHRGAMVQFLKGRGITHTQESVAPNTLKPSQAEFSPEKVNKARGFEGTPRSILVSSDNHVVDGHHQWLASLHDAPNEPIPVIRLNAPIQPLLLEVARFPSSGVDEASASASNGETVEIPLGGKGATSLQSEVQGEEKISPSQGAAQNPALDEGKNRAAQKPASLSDEQMAERIRKRLDAEQQPKDDAPPVNTKLDAVKQERERVFAELRKLTAKRSTTLNSGVPVSTEELTLMVRLVRTYIDEGVLRFKDAARRFLEDFGEGAHQFGRAFEIGWEEIKESDGAEVDAAGKWADAVEPASRQTSDFGTVEHPDIVAIARSFSHQFANERRFNTIVEARTFAAGLVGGKIETGTHAAKKIDEAIELGVVLEARRLVESARRSGLNSGETYRQLVDLYRRQPTLGVRTSTSVQNQAYSSPAPLAYVASELTGITEGTTVYEPTAGNGMLLIGTNPEKATANELNGERADNLRRALNPRYMSESDATVYEPGRKVDAVIANPPFGSVGKEFRVDAQYTTREIDHAIALKALEAMRDDGRAALILGGINSTNEKVRSDGYNGKSKRAFYYTLYNQYNVVDHFTVDGDLYKKQGAAWPVDVIIIDGRGKSERQLPAVDVPRIYDSWEALAEKLNDVPQTGNSRVDAERRSDLRQSSPAGATDSRGGRSPVGSEDGHGDLPESSGRQSAEDGGRVGDALAVSNQSVGGNGTLGRDARKGGRGQQSDAQQPADARTLLRDGAALQPAADARRERPAGAENHRRDDARTVGERSDDDAHRNPPVRERQAVDAEAKQVPYEPASQVSGKIGTLVPANMRTATGSALDSLEARVGPLHEYVASLLDYQPEEINQYFAAEQLDALALALDSMQRGTGFIIGDQTGIGKGRVVAGVMRYARITGRTPIFVTEKPNLYKDIVRDLSDIGEGAIEELRPRVLMTNGNETVPLDDDATVSLRTPKTSEHNAELRRLASEGTLGSYEYVFTTYPQMQTVQGKRTDRQDFLDAFSEGGIVVFDESHNAGGSEKKEDPRGGVPTLDRALFARRLAARADGVFFSSATYAKRPSVMDLYARTDMRLAVPRIEDLPEAITKGGVPLQQVVAAMLTESGQYIRRERSFDGVTYETKVAPVDKKSAEAVSAVMRAVQRFDEAKTGAVEAIKDEVKKEAKAVSGDGSVGKAGVASTNFTSIMHNLIEQMLLSLKMDAAVEEARAALERGEKPVVTVSNTMGSFIQSYVEDYGLGPGDAIGLTFGDMMLRYLERTRDVLIGNAFGAKTRKRLTDAELGAGGVRAYEEAKKLINETDWTRMPVSPIDYIKAKLGHLGYKVGEITGRQHVIDYRGETPVYRMRPAGEIKIAGRNKTISAFNSGALDALILNQAGSTGLSLHASEKFKDRRKRHMIIAQAERNIDTHMQMLGRVHRTGQIVTPSYAQLVADIPAEKRPASVLAKKMASLNANTTASRDSHLTAKDVPDFMNEYGDEVAASLMEDNPDLHRKLGSPIKESESGTGLEREGAMRKLTGRIPLLSIREQEDIYSQLESEYEDFLAQKEAMGENALEAKTLDLDARPVRRTQIFEGTGDRPFARGAFADEMDVKRMGGPYTSEQVIKLVQQSVGSENTSLKSNVYQNSLLQDSIKHTRDLMDAVRGRFKEYKRELLDDVENEEKRKATETKLDGMHSRWHNALIHLFPGAGVRLTSQMGEMYGVVVKVEQKGRPNNPVALGSWKVTFALTDAARHVTVPFSKLHSADEVEDGDLPGGHTAFERASEQPVLDRETLKRINVPVLEAFDRAQSASRERRTIVTGNLLAGFGKFPKGQIINFTDHEGQMRQGVLMPRDFNVEKALSEEAVEFQKPEHILAFLERHGGLVHNEEQTFRVSKAGANFRFVTPASKARGGTYFLNETILDAAGTDFVKSGQFMALNVGRDAALGVIRAAQGQGTRFLTTSYKQEARNVTGKQLPIPGGDIQNSLSAPPAYFIPQNEDEYNQVKKRLRSNAQRIWKEIGRPGTFSSNAAYPAELVSKLLPDLARLGAYHLRNITRAAANLTEERIRQLFVSAMVDDLGAGIRPHLRKVYKEAQKLVEREDEGATTEPGRNVQQGRVQRAAEGNGAPHRPVGASGGLVADDSTHESSANNSPSDSISVGERDSETVRGDVDNATRARENEERETEDRPDGSTRQTRERAFPQTLDSAGLEGGDDRTYNVVTNAESLAEAEAIISEKGIDGAIEFLHNSEDIGAEHTALAYKLLSQLDGEKAVEVASDISRKLTRQGQAIAAAQIVSRLSPERVAVVASRVAERAGVTLTPERLERLKRLAHRALEEEERADNLERKVANLQAQLRTAKAEKEQKRRRLVPTTKVAVRATALSKRFDRLEEQARERLAARKGVDIAANFKIKGKDTSQAGASAIPADLADWAIIGAAKMARGSLDFAAWSSEMLADLDEEIRPYLRAVYLRSLETLKEERAALRQERLKRSAVRGAITEETTEEEIDALLSDAEEVARLMAEAEDARRESVRRTQELAQAFEQIEQRSVVRRAGAFAADALNAFRGLMASGDLPPVLRQGLVLSLNHPPTALRSFVRATVAGVRKSKYESIYEEIKAHPRFKQARGAGLYLAYVEDEKTEQRMTLSALTRREEQFNSRLVAWMPHVKFSSRNFTAFMDLMRLHAFTAFAEHLEAAEMPKAETERAVSDAARFVNVASGRGTLGERFDKALPVLSAAFFSPRYLLSRAQLAFHPLTYSRPAMRHAYFQLFKAAGALGMLMALAAWALPDLELEWDDPEDADWLKLKMGDARWDVLGGFQQPARFVYRLAHGLLKQEQGKKLSKGEEPASIIKDFARRKLSPQMGLVVDRMVGTTLDYDEKTGKPKPFKWHEQVWGDGWLPEPKGAIVERLAPISAMDVVKATRKEGAAGFVKSSPSMIGVGYASYKQREEARMSAPVQKVFDEYGKTPYNAPPKLNIGGRERELSIEERSRIEADVRREVDARVQKLLNPTDDKGRKALDRFEASTGDERRKELKRIQNDASKDVRSRFEREFKERNAGAIKSERAQGRSERAVKRIKLSAADAVRALERMRDARTENR